MFLPNWKPVEGFLRNAIVPHATPKNVQTLQNKVCSSFLQSRLIRQNRFTLRSLQTHNGKINLTHYTSNVLVTHRQSEQFWPSEETSEALHKRTCNMLLSQTSSRWFPALLRQHQPHLFHCRTFATQWGAFIFRRMAKLLVSFVTDRWCCSRRCRFHGRGDRV